MHKYNTIEGVLFCETCGRRARYIDMFVTRVPHCDYCEKNLTEKTKAPVKGPITDHDPGDQTDPWIRAYGVKLDSVKAGDSLKISGTSVILRVKSVDKTLRRVYFDSPIIASCDEDGLDILEPVTP